MSSQRTFFGIAILAFAASVIFLGVRFVLPGPTDPPVKPKEDPVAPKVQPEAGPVLPPPLLKNVFIGRSSPTRPRKIHTVMTTRKGDTTYQGLIRYEPQLVPVAELPGL